MRYSDFKQPLADLPELQILNPHDRELVIAKKQELDNKHLSVKLKRCRQGIPPNPHWDRHWKAYKQWALQNYIFELLSLTAKPEQESP
jgi:hypothetical protein